MQIPFLDRLLSGLEVNVDAFALCEVQTGFSLALDGLEHPLIHYILKGPGILRLEGGRQIEFSQHDFILLPPRQAHWIEAPSRSQPEVRGPEFCTALVDGVLRMAAAKDRRADVASMCGMIEATYAGSLGLFDALDEPIRLHLAQGSHLRQAIEALLAELAEPRLGTNTLAEALLKQCIILLIRELAEDPARVQWLFGAIEPRLLRPVLAMIERPAHDFSLESLAEMAGMSRSGFAAQFSTAFGQPPIDFLKSVRLRRAARLLERTDLPVAMIARSIGYESRTYFSRAFRAEFGLDPRAYRARRRRMPLA